MSYALQRAERRATAGVRFGAAPLLITSDELRAHLWRIDAAIEALNADMRAQWWHDKGARVDHQEWVVPFRAWREEWQLFRITTLDAISDYVPNLYRTEWAAADAFAVQLAEWRASFAALGGKLSTPALPPPDAPDKPATVAGVSVSGALRTAAWIAGGLTLAYLLQSVVATKRELVG